MCFEKICESLNKIWKFELKFWKFLKFFESFKENVNKNSEKLNKNYNFLLLSILIASWGLGCSPSFANFPGFRGGGEASSFPPLGTPLVDTLPLSSVTANDTYQKKFENNSVHCTAVVSKQKSQRAPSIGAKNSSIQNVWKILRPKGPVGPAGPVMDNTAVQNINHWQLTIFHWPFGIGIVPLLMQCLMLFS